MNTNISLTRRNFLIASALGSLALLTGCQGKTQSQPRHLYVGLDTSGSAREQIGGFLACAVTLAEELHPSTDSLTIFRVGHETREFTDGRFDGDTEALARTLKAETEPIAEKRGTLPAAFWQAVAQRVKDEGNAAITVVFFTDGFNDDQRNESWKAMSEAADIIASNPAVLSVIVCGAHAETWAQLQQTFNRLGDRFHPLSPTQCNPGTVTALLAEPGGER